jgi:NAD(P)-dependent dehydrogenase (short-subunit alcohol dehydrogenase family)
MKDLQGRVCFVTGDSRGIGRTIVLALAEAGADVAFTYMQNHDMAEEICRAPREKGVRCKAYHDDAASAEETEGVVKEVIAHFGRIQKGMEAAQATNYPDTQAKMIEFCESSLKSLKANTQAIVDFNAKAMVSWLGFVKKMAAEVPEPKAEMR